MTFEVWSLFFSVRAALQLKLCADQLHEKPYADSEAQPSAHSINTPHHPLLPYPNPHLLAKILLFL